MVPFPSSNFEGEEVLKSFNGKLREELLNVEIFTTLFEAQVLIERRKDCNQIRPLSGLGYRLLRLKLFCRVIVQQA